MIKKCIHSCILLKLSPKCINLITSDQTSWEDKPLSQLVSQNQLMAFQHEGFWQPMDTLRDKISLEGLWSGGNAPWKVWE